MSNGSEPAFSITAKDYLNLNSKVGITKRELMAAMCLQGLLSTLPTLRSADKNYVAHTALEYTDALLRELSSNKESGE